MDRNNDSLNTSLAGNLSRNSSADSFERFERAEENILKQFNQNTPSKSGYNSINYFSNVNRQIPTDAATETMMQYSSLFNSKNDPIEQIMSQLNSLLYDPHNRQQEQLFQQQQTYQNVQQQQDQSQDQQYQQRTQIPVNPPNTQFIRDQRIYQGNGPPRPLVELYQAEKQRFLASRAIVEGEGKSFERTYQQKLHLKEKKVGADFVERSQKVAQFMKENAIFSNFDKHRYLYDDHYLLPVDRLRKEIQKYNELCDVVNAEELEESQRKIFVNQPDDINDESEQNLLSSQNNAVFAVKSTRHDFSQELPENDLLLFKKYFTNKEVNEQEAIQQERAKRKEGALIRRQNSSIGDFDSIYERQDLLDEEQRLKNDQKQTLENETIMMKNKFKQDSKSILYAFSNSSAAQRAKGSEVCQMWLRNYGIVEGQFEEVESSSTLAIKVQVQEEERVNRLQKALNRSHRVQAILEQMVINGVIREIEQFFPFEENQFPLWNCEKDSETLEYRRSQAAALEELGSLDEAELRKYLEQQRQSGCIVVLRVIKKNRNLLVTNVPRAIEKYEMNNMKTTTNYYREAKLAAIAGPAAPQISIPKVLTLDKINSNIENASLVNYETADLEKYEVGGSLLDEYVRISGHRASADIREETLAHLQIESNGFQVIDQSAGGIRGGIGDVSSGETSRDSRLMFLQAKKKRKQKTMNNGLGMLKRQATLNRNGEKDKREQANAELVRQIESDIFISKLVEEITKSQSTSKTSRQNQSLNKKSSTNNKKEGGNDGEDGTSDKYQDLILAASVIKKSANKDVFKLRWLELWSFNLQWYDKAPLTNINGKKNAGVKPNGFGDIAVQQIKDIVVGTKHAFAVCLTNKRNLVIDYDKTRVGWMWCKTLRNFVGLKAYMLYMLRYGCRNRLFEYFEDESIRELDLSENMLNAFRAKVISIEIQLCQIIFDSISYHSNLSVINLRNSGLSHVSYKELFKFLNRPLNRTRITTLNLQKNHFDDETTVLLSDYIKGDNCLFLDTLLLDDCNLGDSRFALIVDSIRLRYLWQLPKAQNTNPTFHTEEADEKSWRQSRMTYCFKLDKSVEGAGIGSPLTTSVAAAPAYMMNSQPKQKPVHFFKRFGFSGIKITDIGLDMFMTAIDQIWMEGAHYFSDEEDFERIIVDFSKNEFSQDGIECFGSFLQKRQIIIKLIMDSLINASAEGISYFLRCFVDNYRMEELSLRGIQLSLDGCESLMYLLRHNYSLKQVNVDVDPVQMQKCELFSSHSKRDANVYASVYSISMLQ